MGRSWIIRDELSKYSKVRKNQRHYELLNEKFVLTRYLHELIEKRFELEADYFCIKSNPEFYCSEISTHPDRFHGAYISVAEQQIKNELDDIKQEMKDIGERLHELNKEIVKAQQNYTKFHFYDMEHV